jgi:hypothetical protein
MGFSYKSNGLAISPGEKLQFPIAAQELSVLNLQWSSENEQELDFKLSFTPEAGGEESVLLPSERLHKTDSKLDIEGPGTCFLQWTNNSVGGWFGPAACTVAYTATLQSKREIEEEETKRLEGEEEERRKEAERLAAEQRAQEEERARVRRQEREEKLTKLRAEAKIPRSV